MRTKLAPALLGLALLAAPLLASATATDDLIQDLLRQIQQLQQQLRELPRQGNTPLSCVVLNNNLYLGLSDSDTNGEVTKLQHFLASDRSIYPEGLITGYFGPATERAVMRYQSRNNIVSSGTPDTTGYGAVGPKTRQAMASSCGTGSGTFKATPTSGVAPLTIGFTGIASRVNSIIEFGDGNSRIITNFADPPAGAEVLPMSAPFAETYTYKTAGTHTAKLKDMNGTCTGTTCDGNVVGTVTIIVTGSGGVGCEAAITHDLQRGDSDAEVGGDVTMLQNFLKNKTTVYPGGLVTGFFGRSTEAAVRAFQKEHNILQTGFVGPLTRAAIKAVCDGTTSNTPYKFSATPVSGAAPLAVAFVAVNVESLQTLKYVVDFGDSARGDMTEESDSSLKVSHSYTAGGSFTAKLLEVTELCGAGVTQYGCVRELQVDSLTVTVTSPVVPPAPPPTPGGDNTNTDCAPSSASSPEDVLAEPANGSAPLKVTFSIGGGLGWDTIDFGDGTSYAGPFRWDYPGHDNVTCVTHTYASAGSYPIRLKYKGQLWPIISDTVIVTASSATCTFDSAPVAIGSTAICGPNQVGLVCSTASGNPPQWIGPTRQSFGTNLNTNAVLNGVAQSCRLSTGCNVLGGCGPRNPGDPIPQ